jgi:hypothetical protein
MGRRIARQVTGVGAAGALAMGGTASAATPSHQTSAAQPASAVQPASVAQPAASWHFIDSYFWASSCNATGNRGMDNGDWTAYECRDGSAFSDYNLWVWY